MWCKHCHQEVPGVARQGDKPVCPRCGEPVEVPVSIGDFSAPVSKESTRRSMARAALVYQSRLPPCKDWELDDTLQRIELAVRPQALTPVASRIDTAHSEPGAPHVVLARPGAVIRTVEEFQARGVLPSLGWFALFLGTMAASCGGALLIWSRVAGRPELWPVGQPIALGGVCCLLVALVLQLDGALGGKAS